jgi:hypothetical protein
MRFIACSFLSVLKKQFLRKEKLSKNHMSREKKEKTQPCSAIGTSGLGFNSAIVPAMPASFFVSGKIRIPSCRDVF